MAAEIAERPGPLRVHGNAVREMLDDSSWVRRRVEQIGFLDDRTVRRRISVDFQVPRGYVEEPGLPERTRFVPLALLKKDRPLVDFDLLDEEGRSLPLLTSEQAQQLGGAMLVSTAATNLERARAGAPSDRLVGELKRLVACDPGESETILRDVFGRGRPGHRLAGEHLLLRLARDLAQSYLIVTEVAKPEHRRIFKLSFRERLTVRGLGPASALGWGPLPVVLNAPGVALSASYHCEVSAPAELEVCWAELRALAPDGDPRARAATTDVGPLARQTPADRVHLQLTGLRSDDQGELVVMLRTSQPGLPGRALMLALGVALLLSAGVVFHDRVSTSDGTIGVLVAIPALIAAYIARPDHLLSKRLLRGVGLLAAGVGALAFVAAASLVFLDGIVMGVWLALAVLAWISTVLLGLSCLLPAMRGTQAGPRNGRGTISA